MKDIPGKIWNWYVSKPLWVRIIAFVFIIAIIAVIGTVYYVFLRGCHSNATQISDDVSVAKEVAEIHTKQTNRREEVYQGFIEEEKKKRDESDGRTKQARKERNDVDAQIDSAGSIDDVDAALYK